MKELTTRKIRKLIHSVIWAFHLTNNPTDDKIINAERHLLNNLDINPIKITSTGDMEFDVLIGCRYWKVCIWGRKDQLGTFWRTSIYPKRAVK